MKTPILLMDNIDIDRLSNDDTNIVLVLSRYEGNIGKLLGDNWDNKIYEMEGNQTTWGYTIYLKQTPRHEDFDMYYVKSPDQIYLISTL